MTLEQLRIFIAVAQKQHVTQAARELNLTQSATSAAIAALEDNYQIKLFHRVGRGIVLTQTGLTFLDEAYKIVNCVKAAEQVLHDVAGLKQGFISIAGSQTVANYWLPSRAKKFRDEYPGIELKIKIGNTEQVALDVLSGSADIGFVEGAIDYASLSVEEIEGDRLIVVVGKSHPWAHFSGIEPEDLTKTRWVLREQGSGTRSMFEVALAGFGLKLSDLAIILELPSNEALRTVTEMSDCATVVSDLVAEQSLKAGTLHHVQIDLSKRPFSVLRHKDKYNSLALSALIRSFR